MKNETYKNWKEFIHATLTKSNQFGLDKSFGKGETDIEIYRQQVGDKEARLRI